MGTYSKLLYSNQPKKAVSKPEEPFAKQAELPTDKRLFIKESPTLKKKEVIPSQRPTGHKAEGTTDRRNDRPVERLKVRQGFDVFKDQVLSLSEIQLALYKQGGKKPLMGELVREALDAYIKEKRAELGMSNRPTGETTDRPA